MYLMKIFALEEQKTTSDVAGEHVARGSSISLATRKHSLSSKPPTLSLQRYKVSK